MSEARYTELINIQSEISDERSQLFFDEKIDVLIEDIDEESNEAWGRSFRDAPEVDGIVNVTEIDAEKLKSGDIVKAKIFDCEEKDLFGEFITK